MTFAIAPTYYAIKLIKNGPRVACKIWYSAPCDPVTGDELDRSPRWHCEVSGKLIDDPFRVIILIGDASNPVGVATVKGDEIDAAEYRHLIDVYNWAMENEPDAPEASPREAINFNKLPSIF